MNANELFDPARLPERDEMGYTYHPDMDILTEGLGDGDVIPESRFAELGIERYWLHSECDAGFDEETMYDDHGFGRWRPSPGDGWRTACMFDTEDGPVALFVRPKVAA